MAIYHLSMSPVSRKAGRSATASAAYCSAEKIVDERTQTVHDYTRKRGVVHSEIVLPSDAPAWAKQRAALWNAVEQHNRRADAVVARSMTVALPHELTDGQRRQLISGFARHIADRYRIGVDVAIHRPSGPDERNHHAHLLLTSNRLSAAGLGKKARELDPIARAKAGPGENAAEQLRQTWEQHANHALELAGQAPRIDHRTLAAQGIDREPTHHLGPAAAEYERRTGQPSRRRRETEPSRELADINRDLNRTQRDLERARQYVSDLEEARRGRAQALAEERAESEQRRQAEQRQTQPTHAERERIERMTAKELAAEIQRLTPRPVEEALDRHPDVINPRFEAMQLGRELTLVQITTYRVQREAADWRDAHPVRAHLHRLGVSHPYLAERERIEREQTQRGQALRQARDQADQQARQAVDRLRPVLIAEQQQTQARLAELERLRQAKATQEQAQERLPAARPRQAAPTSQARLHAVQKPLQTASARQEPSRYRITDTETTPKRQHPQATQKPPETALQGRQAAPTPQPLPTPTLEPTVAQKPLQTPPERRQAAQERPLTAPEQEKARQLRAAVETLDKRSALLRFPELIQLYPLVAHAARFAEERLFNAEQRAAFVEAIKERGIRELAQGKTLPKPAIPPEQEPKIERTRERDYGPSL